MDTEPAPFTQELLKLLGLMPLPKVVEARIVTPLKSWPVREKVQQKRRHIKKPGCVFQRGNTWVFRIAYLGHRMQKGSFPDEASARKDMLRWLEAQRKLCEGE